MAKTENKLDELKSMINPTEHKVVDAISKEMPGLIPALLESAKKAKTKQSIISRSEAAQLAGVSRQALHGMFKNDNSPFRFFTPDGKVDTSSPDWKDYLDIRKHKNGDAQPTTKPAATKKPIITNIHGGNSCKNNAQLKDKPHLQDERGNKSSAPNTNGWNKDHALTGGYDPARFVPTNPAQLKALTDIVARNLEIRIKLGDLIPRETVDQYIDQISQGINQFVSLGRSVSTDICEKLDRIGMEREVEKMINPKVKSIIEQLIRACNNAKK